MQHLGKTIKHKDIWRHTSTFGLQPHRGRVACVPWRCHFCPTDILPNLCRFTHTNQVGTSRMSLVPSHSQIVPRRFRGKPTNKLRLLALALHSQISYKIQIKAGLSSPQSQVGWTCVPSPSTESGIAAQISQKKTSLAQDCRTTSNLE